MGCGTAPEPTAYTERTGWTDTPGYDPVAATGQVGGGANVLCFTTARGSAYGCKPTPSIKLATNSAIYRRMIDHMDLNRVDVLEGVSLEAKGEEIFPVILRVASGERTKSELLGYGDNEYAPWHVGATMWMKPRAVAGVAIGARSHSRTLLHLGLRRARLNEEFGGGLTPAEDVYDYGRRST